TSRVGEDAPSRSLAPAVQGARVQESLTLGRLVVGAEVKVCAHLARRLVEPLEEQLDGRAVIVVPLPGELRGVGAHPPAPKQGPPEGNLAVMPADGRVDADLHQ